MKLKIAAKQNILCVLWLSGVFVQPLVGEALPVAECKNCHAREVAEWKRSRHVLQKGLEAVMEYSAQNPDEKEWCYRCHFPDWEVLGRSKGTRRVGCVFCHFTKGLANDRQWPYVIATGIFVYGPEGRAGGSGHGSIKASFFSTSRFCKGCHTWKTPAGVLIMGEDDASGPSKQCQDCHMKSNGTISHTFEPSMRALVVKASCEYPADGTVVVTVTLENKSAHFYPAGIVPPSLELTLEYEDGVTHTTVEHRAFGRVLSDSEYKIINDPSNAFFYASMVVDDTRLKPFEKKRLHLKYSPGWRKQGKLLFSAELKDGEVIKELLFSLICPTIKKEEGEDTIPPPSVNH